jgi:magnesium transporter
MAKMARFLKRRKKGLPPGSLVYIADVKHEGAKVTAINYTPDLYSEREVLRIEDCIPDTQDPSNITWVNIQGLSDTKVIEEIGKIFGIHQLWLEDLLNTDHRPKLEELDDLLFMILKGISSHPQRKRQVFFAQCSLFLGPQFVISVQEYPDDLFNSVKERLRKGLGKIRNLGADYLFYSLVDTQLDSYFSVMESLGSEIEAIESKLYKPEVNNIPKQITRLKTELLYVRKAMLPIRESLAQISKLNREDISAKTLTFFRDAWEHAVQIVDVVNNYQELLTSYMEAYKSGATQKLNEIMKTLTIFTSLFIPLNFIVGIYGMNFEFMPELTWKWGYYGLWTFMLLVTVSLLYYFKKKKWL